MPDTLPAKIRRPHNLRFRGPQAHGDEALVLLCSKAEADLQRASDAAALEENTGSEGEHDDISPAHIDQVIGSVMAAEERLAEVAATAAQSVSGATAKIELLALVKKTMPFDADIAAGLIQSIAEDYQRGFS